MAGASARLRAAGFEVLMPRQLPVNDAAISYGQLVEAAAVGGIEQTGVDDGGAAAAEGAGFGIERRAAGDPDHAPGAGGAVDCSSQWDKLL